jgi:hypothetical protein
MFLRKILPALIGLILTPASAIIAQESTATPPTPQANREQIRQGRPGFRAMQARKRLAKRAMRDGLRQLSLTDDQKLQRRAIIGRHLSALKIQRDQLVQLRNRKLEGSLTDEDRARARSIRQELRSSMQGMRTELRNSLTAEQRTQLQNFREQRKQRREEFMKRRQEFRTTRPQE